MNRSAQNAQRRHPVRMRRAVSIHVWFTLANRRLSRNTQTGDEISFSDEQRWYRDHSPFASNGCRGRFLLYRKHCVAVKRESDDSYRVKKPCRAGCAPRGEEVSCKQHRSGAENPAEPDSILVQKVNRRNRMEIWDEYTFL